MAVVPFVATEYVVRLLIVVMMFAVMAQGWSIIGGYAGYQSFGHGAFFGVGAYGTAIAMTTLHLPFFPALIIGTLAATLLALLMSPVMRLQGHYFVVVSFAVSEVARELVLNGGSFTGASHGISLPIAPGTQAEVNTFFFYLMLGLLVASLVGTYLLVHSTFGYALVAIRENEATAEESGIATVRVKLIALLLSAAMTAAPGGLYAYWMSFISPGDVFSLFRSVTVVVGAWIGGLGTVLGPTVGTAILLIVGEEVWGRFREASDGVLGILVVIAVLLLPRGIVPRQGEGWRLHPRALIHRLKGPRR